MMIVDADVVGAAAASVARSLQGLPARCVGPGMDDEIEIVLALLEAEIADEMETFDLDRDETREVTAVVELEDQWTQPYVLVRAPERCAEAPARALVRGTRE